MQDANTSLALNAGVTSTATKRTFHSALRGPLCQRVSIGLPPSPTLYATVCWFYFHIFGLNSFYGIKKRLSRKSFKKIGFLWRKFCPRVRNKYLCLPFISIWRQTIGATIHGFDASWFLLHDGWRLRYNDEKRRCAEWFTWRFVMMRGRL